MTQLARILLLALLLCCFWQTACNHKLGSQAAPGSHPTSSDSGGFTTPPPESPGHTTIGPGEGGGGDPDAQLFIIMARKLDVFFRDNLANTELPFKADEFTATVNKLDESIKDKNLIDLLEFTSETLKDGDHVTKMALFNRATSQIKVNRPYWSGAKDQDKFTLIVMEISGLLGVELRYETARALVQSKSALIQSMNVPGTGENTKIAWRIIGQDADLFSRITENDALIDGGIIGNGSASSERAVRFLADPSQDQEWMSLAQAAFKKGVPAYFMLRDENGSNASITAFRGDEKGTVAYSLLFISQAAPVGVCKHTATEISALERLKTCLFDTRFYYVNDSETRSRSTVWAEAFKGVYENLLRHYAENSVAMARALQLLVIQDYRALFYKPYLYHVLRLTTQAYGLRPTFTKKDAPFWEVAGPKEPRGIRFVKAVEFLSQRNLGLYPGRGFGCPGELPKENTLSDPELPRLLPLDQLHKLFDLNDYCLEWNRMGDSPEEILYRVMAERGYTYNPATAQWTEGVARIYSLSLLNTRTKWAHELELKIITEGLAHGSLLNALQPALQSSSVVDRLIVYFEFLPYWKNLSLNASEAEGLYKFALQDLLGLKATDNLKIPDADLLGWSTTYYPLTEFISHAASLAVVNDLFTPELSKQYIKGILSAPWFDGAIAEELFSTLFYTRPGPRQHTYPYFREILSNIIAQPFFDEKLATSLTYSLTMPHSSMWAGSGRNPMHLYTNLSGVMDELLASGKVSEELKAKKRKQIAMFKIAAQFEEQVANLSPDAQAQMLVMLFKTPEDAQLLTDVVFRFLATAGLSPAAQTALLTAYTDKVASLPDANLNPFNTDDGNVLQALMRLPMLIEMNDEQQELVLTFVAQRLNSNGKSALWARGVTVMDLFNDNKWKVKNLRVAQRALELLSETSTEAKNTEVQSDPDWKYTETNSIIDHLESCKSPEYKLLVCKQITDPNKILQKIANNPKIAQQVRDRATSLLPKQ